MECILYQTLLILSYKEIDLVGTNAAHGEDDDGPKQVCF
jgi:hypothetical protein